MEGISRVGQPFMDEKVYVEISRATQTALGVNVGLRELAKPPPPPKSGALEDVLRNYIAITHRPLGSPRITPRIQEFSHVQRVRLNWLKPDGKGGLIPRNEKAKGSP